MRTSLELWSLAAGIVVQGMLLAATAPEPHPRGPVLWRVPAVVQSTHYSCGVAALISALTYYGVEVPNEAELMKLVGTTSDFGTDLKDLVRFARTKGLPAEARHDLTVDDLRAQIRKGHPVLIEFQAWRENGKTKIPYELDWENGHDAVVIGVDGENVYLQDPSLTGSRGFVPIREFDKRWHDVNRKHEKLQHTGIFFGGRPNPPHAWAPVP